MNFPVRILFLVLILASWGVLNASLSVEKEFLVLEEQSDTRIQPAGIDTDFDRDYLQQPPLIPHKIDQYRITIKFNQCLGCHSWQNYKTRNATKISQTHFESRDGMVLANVSARRYFCTQCHVPQTGATPLVENTFQPVEVMRH